MRDIDCCRLGIHLHIEKRFDRQLRLVGDIPPEDHPQLAVRSVPLQFPAPNIRSGDRSQSQRLGKRERGIRNSPLANLVSKSMTHRGSGVGQRNRFHRIDMNHGGSSPLRLFGLPRNDHIPSLINREFQRLQIVLCHPTKDRGRAIYANGQILSRKFKDQFSCRHREQRQRKRPGGPRKFCRYGKTKVNHMQTRLLHCNREATRIRNQSGGLPVQFRFSHSHLADGDLYQ